MSKKELRKAFEEWDWHYSKGLPMTHDRAKDGRYVSVFVEDRWQGFLAGRAAGAEAMRERAANLTDNHCQIAKKAGTKVVYASELADAIRALPLED